MQTRQLNFEAVAVPKPTSAWEWPPSLILSLCKWLRGCSFFLTVFAFLQVRQLLAVPGSPPPACGKGLKPVCLGSGVGAVLLLSPKAFSPSWLEAVLPCSCAGHPLLCLPPVQSPEMISELGEQQTSGHSQPEVLWQGTAYVLGWVTGTYESGRCSQTEHEESSKSGGISELAAALWELWFPWEGPMPMSCR